MWSEVNCVKKDEGCISSIYFPSCVEDDTSYYSAIIMEFVKNGEKDQTDCWFQVDPYPHTFTSKLRPVNCVEKDTVEMEITTEARTPRSPGTAASRRLCPTERGSSRSWR